jgi:hypothetical protein
MESKPILPSAEHLIARTIDGLFDCQHTSSFAEQYLETFYRDRGANGRRTGGVSISGRTPPTLSTQ